MQRILNCLTILENRRLLGISIFIFALIFIITAMVVLPARLYQQHTPPDFVYYYEPAGVNLLEGNGLNGEDGELMVRYPPAFSTNVAVVYGLADMLRLDRRFLLDFVIILYSAISCVLVFYLTKALTHDNIRSLIATGLWLTYPFFLRLTNQPFTEPPFIVVLLLACLVLFTAIQHKPAHYLYFIGCGLLVGLGMLIRPIAIALSPVFALIILLTAIELSLYRRVIAITLLFVSTAVVVLPWQSYASANSGKTILLSSGGFPTVLHGYTFAVPITNRPYEPSIIGLSEDTITLQREIVSENEAGNITGLRTMLGFLWTKLFEQPVATISLMLVKVARSWYSTSSTYEDDFILLLQIPYLSLAIFAIIRGLLIEDKQRRLIIISLLLIVGYFWGITTLTFSILRYMMPIMPLLFIIIGIAIPLPKTLQPDTTT